MWETMVTLCRTAQNKGKSWPDSHDRAIQEVADSWEHTDWLAVLELLRYIQHRLEGPPDRYSRPYRRQQVAWHNQSKAGVDLIMDISGLRRHLPEGFSRCRPTAHSPSIIIQLAELLYIQQAPVDPAHLSQVATNLRQILGLLGPSAATCNFIITMRDRAMSSRPVYQVHPGWAMDARLEGVTLCLRPQGHGGRVDRSPSGEVWWVCQFALTSPEGFLKGHNE